jgi:hypothetical protein
MALPIEREIPSRRPQPCSDPSWFFGRGQSAVMEAGAIPTNAVADFEAGFRLLGDFRPGDGTERRGRSLWAFCF